MGLFVPNDERLFFTEWLARHHIRLCVRPFVHKALARRTILYDYDPPLPPPPPGEPWAVVDEKHHFYILDEEESACFVVDTTESESSCFFSD